MRALEWLQLQLQLRRLLLRAPFLGRLLFRRRRLVPGHLRPLSRLRLLSVWIPLIGLYPLARVAVHAPLIVLAFLDVFASVLLPFLAYLLIYSRLSVGSFVLFLFLALIFSVLLSLYFCFELSLRLL